MQIERIVSHHFSRSNMYILDCDEEGTVGLVDAGIGKGYARLAAALGTRRPKWVFLTHWHLDHVGWLARIVADYTPVVYCAEESVPFVTGKKSWRASYYYQHAAPWWAKPVWGLVFRMWPTQPIAKAQAVKPGDALMLGTQRWEVIALPGHTRGSVGLYHAEQGVLFSGDAVFRARGGAGLQNIPHFDCEDPAQVDATLAKVQEMGIRAIYPGHFSCGAVS